METIIKPYGLFIKAPDRRQQIGAKWLRNSLARPISGSTSSGGPERETCLVQFTPIIEDVVMKSSGTHGITGKLVGS